MKNRPTKCVAQDAKFDDDDAVWKWTLTSQAVAPCYILDVHKMEKHDNKSKEFFWLGRVPCRFVKLVGRLVGIETQETKNKIVYTCTGGSKFYDLDDGTATIECIQRIRPAPLLPSKAETSANPSEQPRDSRPIGFLGSTAEVIGKVSAWGRGERMITIQEISECPSNSEPVHWRLVKELHCSRYSASIAEPFVVPKEPVASPAVASPAVVPGPSRILRADVQQDSVVVSSAKGKGVVRCQTPQAQSYGPEEPQSPSRHRLRHPARLRNRELTANTFRIYLKYYMDETLLAESIANEQGTEGDPEIPTNCLRRSAEGKRPRLPRMPGEDAPPQKRRRGNSEPPPELDEKDPLAFTLSNLRRVPVLKLMAGRVVAAEIKRRGRAESEKLRCAAAGANASRRPQPSVAKSVPSSRPSSLEGVSRKAKLLFHWAIIELLKEGGIVLWDGPRRAVDDGTSAEDEQKLWKAERSTADATGASLASDLTTTTTTTATANRMDSRAGSGASRSLATAAADALLAGEYPVSDPESDEEAYLPLTPALLAPRVRDAIENLMARPAHHRSDLTREHRRARGPPPGPTIPAILAHLRRDDRWKWLGEWHVEQAIELLTARKLVYSPLPGRWEVFDFVPSACLHLS
ncbi:hypothetical protein FISHEDRAFT_60683 [Fistulina hepatica ATCC 64428]|uniref:CST complex subunit Stn1 N-terminal domain-containing protein n=1 Tax=Fistulina hepatica ATCC 64428 TaxID=1128425 RepID=A0A0D7A644_9AGAR|nr:hypothetical protein FISHEDRAFT_60683 [Fistulina hepatica ATCC 64428]